MLTPQELRALDDWRFKSRMPSRAAAIRELLKRGLAGEGLSLADDGSSRRIRRDLQNGERHPDGEPDSG